MPGGLIQLLSTNQEDVFLTGLPSINHFKIVYYRYSNFSLELKEYLVSTYYGNTTYFRVPYDGDLISIIFLQMTLPVLEEINPNLQIGNDKWEYFNRVELPYLPPIITTQIESYSVDSNYVTNTLTFIQNYLFDQLSSTILSQIRTFYYSINTPATVNKLTNLYDLVNDIITLFRGNNNYSSSFFSSLIDFYLTNTNILTVTTSNIYDPIIIDLIINIILNIMIALHTDLIGLLYIININGGIIYYQSNDYNAWVTISQTFFSYLIVSSENYNDLNKYYLTAKTSLYTNYSTIETNVKNLDSTILIDTNTSSIESIATSDETVLYNFNSYIRDQLIALQYEYNYIYAIYNAINNFLSSKINTITTAEALADVWIDTSTQGSLGLSTKISSVIINYFIETYKTINTEPYTLPYQADYLKLFATGFINIANSITSIDPFFANIYSLVNISTVVSDCNTYIINASVNLSITGHNALVSDIGLCSTKLNSIIDSFISFFAYLYNYGGIISNIDVLPINYTLFEGLTNTEQLDAYVKNILDCINEIENSTLLYNNIDYSNYLNTGFYTAKKKYKYTSIIPEFNIKGILDTYIYFDNTPNIISYLQTTVLKRTLTDFEISALTPLIIEYNIKYDYASTQGIAPLRDDTVIKLSNLLGINTASVVNCFKLYPFFANTKILGQNTTTVPQLTEYVTFQSYINQIFIEEMYYEYVYKKTYELFALYKDEPMVELNKWISKLDLIASQFNLTLYQKQILRSFTFFNYNFIVEKIGDAIMTQGKKTIYLYQTLQDLIENTLWTEQLYFLNILSYDQYFNYVRTNYNYAMTIYNQLKKKIQNTIQWKIVLTIPNSDINLTVVEDYYLTNKFNYILNNFNENSYNIYVNNILNNEYNNFNYGLSNNFNQNYYAIKTKVAASISDLKNNVTTLYEGLYYNKISIEILSLNPGSIFDGYELTNFDKNIVHYENHTNSIIDFQVNKTVLSYIVKFNTKISGKIFLTNTKEYYLDGLYNIPIKLGIINIYPNTLFIGYNNKHINCIYRNVDTQLLTVRITMITRFKILCLNNKIYKNNFGIINDDYFLNNDLIINWKTKNLVRNFNNDNIYTNKELQLWYYSNDFAYLSNYGSTPNISPYKDWRKAYNKLPFCWVENIGEKIVKNVQFLIGDQKIDEIDNYWLTIYNSYFKSRNNDRAYYNMIGNVSTLTTLTNGKKPSYTLYIPLMFWFARSNELALPIISLTNTSCRLSFQLEQFQNLITNYSYNIKTSQVKTKVLVEYIYLDLKERLNFIQKKHFYIINTTKLITNNNVDLNIFKFKLNNPVIDIFLVFKDKITLESVDVIDTISLIINGKEIYQITDPAYNKLLIPNEKYYSNINGIITYSFSLYPTQVLPSGSLNFYYITDSFFKYKFKSNINPDTLTVSLYAREYNVLEIMSGQAGLVYSY
jgi:hypothetical protein